MLYRFALVPLAPVLLLQGKRVRRDTPRLPEPDGVRTGKSHQPLLHSQNHHSQNQPLRLLILGDSAAAGVGVAEQAQALTGQLTALLHMDVSLEWTLLAQTGLTTQQIREQLHTPEPQNVDCVVVSAGVNDVTSTVSAKAWIQHTLQLIQQLREQLNAQHILLSPVPAMQHFPALPFPLNWYLGQRAADFNRRLAKFVKHQPDLELLPSLPLLQPSWMAADGFHPGAEGYQQWARELHQCIRARWLDADS